MYLRYISHYKFYQNFPLFTLDLQKWENNTVNVKVSIRKGRVGKGFQKWLASKCTKLTGHDQSDYLNNSKGRAKADGFVDVAYSVFKRTF